MDINYTAYLNVLVCTGVVHIVATKPKARKNNACKACIVFQGHGRKNRIDWFHSWIESECSKKYTVRAVGKRDGEPKVWIIIKTSLQTRKSDLPWLRHFLCDTLQKHSLFRKSIGDEEADLIAKALKENTSLKSIRYLLLVKLASSKKTPLYSYCKNCIRLVHVSICSHSFSRSTYSYWFDHGCAL